MLARGMKRCDDVMRSGRPRKSNTNGGGVGDGAERETGRGCIGSAVYLQCISSFASVCVDQVQMQRLLWWR